MFCCYLPLFIYVKSSNTTTITTTTTKWIERILFFSSLLKVCFVLVLFYGALLCVFRFCSVFGQVNNKTHTLNGRTSAQEVIKHSIGVEWEWEFVPICEPVYRTLLSVCFFFIYLLFSFIALMSYVPYTVGGLIRLEECLCASNA